VSKWTSNLKRAAQGYGWNQFGDQLFMVEILHVEKQTVFIAVSILTDRIQQSIQRTIGMS